MFYAETGNTKTTNCSTATTRKKTGAAVGNAAWSNQSLKKPHRRAMRIRCTVMACMAYLVKEKQFRTAGGQFNGVWAVRAIDKLSEFKCHLFFYFGASENRTRHLCVQGRYFATKLWPHVTGPSLLD